MQRKMLPKIEDYMFSMLVFANKKNEKMTMWELLVLELTQLGYEP